MTPDPPRPLDDDEIEQHMGDSSEEPDVLEEHREAETGWSGTGRKATRTRNTRMRGRIRPNQLITNQASINSN